MSMEEHCAVSVYLMKKGKVTEKLNVIAGLLNNKIIAPLVYTYSTNTLVFNAWLEKCLIPVLPENCVIIMDNASFHKSNETKEIIENEKPDAILPNLGGQTGLNLTSELFRKGILKKQRLLVLHRTQI